MRKNTIFSPVEMRESKRRHRVGKDKRGYHKRSRWVVLSVIMLVCALMSVVRSQSASFCCLFMSVFSASRPFSLLTLWTESCDRKMKDHVKTSYFSSLLPQIRGFEPPVSNVPWADYEHPCSPRSTDVVQPLSFPSLRPCTHTTYPRPQPSGARNKAKNNKIFLIFY